MSIESLMQATRDTIRAAFKLDELGCEVMPDGRPTPMAGQVFFAVHPGGSNNSSDLSVDELFDFSVTLTMRTGVPPYDRIGTNVMLDRNGVLAMARRMAILVGMNYDLMNAANAIITGVASDANGFIRPPVFRSMQYLGAKGGDWFFADPDEDVSGLAVQVEFRDARRVQYLEAAT